MDKLISKQKNGRTFVRPFNLVIAIFIIDIVNC